MKVLLTNDDGFHAQGLAALCARGVELGHTVYVAAPDRERSACGHSITLHQPLMVEPVNIDGLPCPGFKISGTPADCVKLAVQNLIPDRVDLVLSGINHGPNLGTDVFYSGTVSGAIEGTILGLAAIAVSYADFDSTDYSFAARVAWEVAEFVHREGLPQDTLLNINVPPMAEDQTGGLAITRLGKRQYRNYYEVREGRGGKKYYWLRGEVLELEGQNNTDIEAVSRDRVAVTAIHLDMTAPPLDNDLVLAIEGLKIRS